MKTTVCFASKKFAECVDFCLALDKKCFPQKMWLDDGEICGLLKAEAWATTVTYNGQKIGLSITMPEKEAGILLDGADQLFTPQRWGAYSYSEAIHPDFQNQGIGSLLIRETMIFIADKGFTSLSAHVRRKNGWDEKREGTISLIEKRPVEGFWPPVLKEPVMFQNAHI